jgi:NAD(P)-dependent dehydrogenase (short-subunit alcohol dehydrogenase family)
VGTLDGKVAIVTGAGQGVGRGIALALAKEGAAVAVVDRNGDHAGTTAAEIVDGAGGTAIPITTDVRDAAAVDECVAAVIERFGTVDILVNNAQAAPPAGPLENMTEDDWRLAIDSGLMGSFFSMRACFPYLKEHGGKIVNLRSSAGTDGMAFMAAYAAAKEAIGGLTRTAAREWGKYGINVNAISPAANSPGMAGWVAADPERSQRALDRNPISRLGDCERDIGRSVVFLVGPDSDYITGMTIMVDGGASFLH